MNGKWLDFFVLHKYKKITILLVVPNVMTYNRDTMRMGVKR